MINLGIGIYLFAISLSKDLKNDLHSFNESKIFIEGDQMQAIQQLVHFCHFHSISKRLDKLEYIVHYKLKYLIL